MARLPRVFISSRNAKPFFLSEVERIPLNRNCRHAPESNSFFSWGVRVAASLKESKSGVEFVNNLTLSCEFESQPSEELFFS